MATSAFGKAFRAARDSGDKEFEYEGKKYNTKLKEEDSAPAKKAPKSSSDEDMSPTKANAVKINGASTDSARDTDSLKTTSLKNKPAPAAAAAPAAKTSTDFTPGKVPSSEQAAANRAAAVDKVKSVAGSIGDYFSNFKTPAERRSDEAKQSTGMKKGGSVSASSRGDGIAQRGKTRGKMC